MKRIFIGFFLLTYWCGINAAVTEKDDIIFEYGKIESNLWKVGKSHSYQLKIINNSARTISVKPAVLSVTLVPHDHIIPTIMNNYQFVLGLCAILLTMGISLPKRDFDVWKLCIITGSGIGYFAWSGMKKDKAILEEEIFHTPITVPPGKTVKKLFWPAHPHGDIHINLDAVTVL